MLFQTRTNAKQNRRKRDRNGKFMDLANTNVNSKKKTTQRAQTRNDSFGSQPFFCSFVRSMYLYI